MILHLIKEYMRVFYVKYPLQKDFIYKIRCWIKHPQKDIDELTFDINDFIQNVYFNVSINENTNEETLMNRIVDKYHNELAAVEITDKTGDGVLSYINWP